MYFQLHNPQTNRPAQSSRPPSTTTAGRPPEPSGSNPALPDTEDTSAPALLANDVALQRLIAESHLFSTTAHSATRLPTSLARGRDRPFGTGRTRHYANDLRLQSLGGGDGIYVQKDMPLVQRRGMAVAAAGREAQRRREAREGGVILEKEQKNDKKRDRSRRAERAVDVPSVGKLRGAELRLSRRDVREIEGPKEVAGKKRRRRR